LTQCCSCSPTPRAAIAHGPDPGSGGLPRQDPLPEKGSNGNGTVTDPSSFARGQLLKKYAGTTTFNLRGLDGALLREVELKAGAYEWVKDYIYRDGLLLASQHRTEGHQHYHLDHLGTTRMLTNRCGERVKRYELFPYGDTISPPANDTETHRFTGHQRDLGSLTNTTDDLEYMHARYYGVKMGRLLSVDVGGARPVSPQTWNRFSYASNSPVSFLDPDGKAIAYFFVGYSNDIARIKSAWPNGNVPNAGNRPLWRPEVPGVQNTLAKLEEGTAPWDSHITGVFSYLEQKATVASLKTAVSDPDGLAIIATHAGNDPARLRLTTDRTEVAPKDLGSKSVVIVVAGCNSAGLAGSFGIREDTKGRVFLGFRGTPNSNEMTAFVARFVVLMSRPGMTVQRALELMRGEALYRSFQATGDQTVSLR